MHLTYKEDPIARAGYLSLAEPVPNTLGRVKKTFEYNLHTYIDFGADDEVLGIEFLSLPPSIGDEALREYARLSPAEIGMVQSLLAKQSGKS